MQIKLVFSQKNHTSKNSPSYDLIDFVNNNFTKDSKD